MASDRRGDALRDPRLAPRDGRAAMLELKGIPYKRVDLMPVISQGRPASAALPLEHGAVAEDRRAQAHGLARDRDASSTGSAPSRRSPRRPGRAGRGRGGRALGRRGPAGDRAPDPLERAEARPRAARQLRRGRPARASRSGSPSKTAAPIVAAAARINERRRRDASAPTSRRSRDRCSGSTTGSPRACSAASRRTRPTSRSPPACACR